MKQVACDYNQEWDIAIARVWNGHLRFDGRDAPIEFFENGGVFGMAFIQLDMDIGYMDDSSDRDYQIRDCFDTRWGWHFNLLGWVLYICQGLNQKKWKKHYFLDKIENTYDLNFKSDKATSYVSWPVCLKRAVTDVIQRVDWYCP